ncbi:hypothetical protein V2J09_017839 [Rumex salicifolius]
MNFFNMRLLFSLRCPSYVPRSFLSSLRCWQDGKGVLSSHHRRWFSTGDFEHDELVDDGKAKEKEIALYLALKQVSGDFGKESMLSLSRFFRSRHTPIIPTGSLRLDSALGIGGLPKGRMVEIYGKEASGKTTLALNIIKEAQKLGGYCAYLDAENALDPVLADSIGVDTENLLLVCPDSAENMLSVVDTLTRSGAVDVVVVDSVAALVPQCELDGSIEFGKKYTQSEVMTKAIRKIHYSLCQSKTLIIFLNQVRSKVTSDNGFQYAQEVTCGGNALKFYAAVRLRISRIGLCKTDDRFTGLGICVQVVKNKLAPAMKKAELNIQFGRGITCESEVLEMACEHGLIQKGDSYFIGDKIFDHKQSAERYLAENDDAREKMIKDLRALMFEI